MVGSTERRALKFKIDIEFLALFLNFERQTLGSEAVFFQQRREFFRNRRRSQAAGAERGGRPRRFRFARALLDAGFRRGVNRSVSAAGADDRFARASLLRLESEDEPLRERLAVGGNRSGNFDDNVTAVFVSATDRRQREKEEGKNERKRGIFYR